MMAFAKELVLTYGKILRETRHHQIQTKDSISDLVSDMDTWIEQEIIKHIHKAYPEHTCLCEESEKVLSDHTWILDPIDGTTNYISKHRDFAISLAFYKNKKPVLGIVYDVMRDEVYSAIHHKGAMCNGVALEKLRTKQLEECILDISMGSMYRLKERKGYDIVAMYPNLRGHRSLNCASLAICHIAHGLCDSYISYNVKCWDYAAAILILEECGGSYAIAHDFFTTKSTLAYFACSKNIVKHVQAELQKNI